jgi:hypothetical protein
LLLQATFWLQHLGYIDKTAGVKSEDVDAIAEVADVSETSAEVESGTIEAHAELATADVGDESGQPAEPADTTEPVEAGGGEAKILAKFTLKSRQAVTLIWVCNFILVIAATLYCLTLLMSIKISLVGRLGGINHICRAFILSLFGLVLLLPWQEFFGDVVAGAIYTPQELLCAVAPTAEDSVVSQIFYYLRFVMLWVITFMLFFFAQVRSARWSGATLRRLGMIH